jgi:hypothetical protein
MARHIDKITVDKIMDAANVVDVIGDFFDLRKRGVEYVCLCPFHEDKTLGNFSINPNKGIYKCFACGAGGNAVDFLMNYRETRLTYPEALRYLAKKYSISIPEDDDDQQQRWAHVKPAKPRAIIETKKQLLIMPRDMVTLTMGRQPKDERLFPLMDKCNSRRLNYFIDWLRSLPWATHQRKMLEDVLWLYCVGRFQHRVVFWQIDEQGQPHSGKLMAYMPNIGKRVREGNDSNPGWLHNQDGIRQLLDLEHYGYQPTLFGLHLLNRYPKADINIVESEKTALLMTIFQCDIEHHLWMACGGLEHLKVESLRPLIESGRRVWVWPDKDGVEKWREKVNHLLSDRFSIYVGFFDRYWIEADGKKADIADIQLRLLCHPETDRQAKANYEARMKGKVQDTPPTTDTSLHWYGDQPFQDEEELTDPRIHQWRMAMRNAHSTKWYQRHYPDTMTAEEAVKEYPMLEPLLNDQTE